MYKMHLYHVQAWVDKILDLNRLQIQSLHNITD